MSQTVEPQAQESSKLHWPTALLGAIVAAIFLLAVFSYQVMATEKAVVMTFGNISSVTGPGIHFRWPLPVQSIVKYDVRNRCFDGNIGRMEETMTHDQKNIIVGIYVVYHIEDPAKFHRTAGDVSFAESKLGSIMRTAKNGVIGKYRFDQLVNTDPKKMRLDAIEKEMLSEIAPQAFDQYGLKVVSLGIRTLGVPEKITKDIANRMIKERNVAATQYRKSGEVEAAKIKSEADKTRALMLADAEAEAKRIRAEGDAEAASHYAVFAENPGLAAFLRKIESLKRILSTKTTLVLDTDSAPFDIMGKASSMQMDASAPATGAPQPPPAPRPGK